MKKLLAARLLQAGADVNKANDNGVTPLNIASDKGHLPVVERLLAAGADLAPVDKWGDTALKSAENKGHAAIARAIRAHMA